MTGCISIWVKNLANVANVAGWVRREGGHMGLPGTSLSAVCLLVGQSTVQSVCLFVFFCVLQISLPDKHMKTWAKHVA